MSKEHFFDIGVNLTHPSFVKDLDEVIANACKVGVDRMCITGTDLEESISASKVTLSLPNKVISTAGIHPHKAKEYSPHYDSQFYQDTHR